VGDLPRRRAASAWLVLAILFLVGSASVNPEPLEGVGKLALHTDKCSYPVGEAVQITFMNVGDGDITYLELGGWWPIPFAVFDESGGKVFVTLQPSMDVVWSLEPGDTITSAWNQTSYAVPGLPWWEQVPPGWYRIYSEGLVSGGITTADAWVAIAVPCGPSTLEADAGPDMTIHEGEPVTLVGTARGGAIAPGNWTLRANLSEERMDLAAVSLGGQVYAIGGNLYDEGSGGLATDVVEVYDPIDNVTRKKAPLPAPRTGPAAATVGGTIHVIGGYVNRTLGFVGWHDEYDAATDAWTARSPMPISRAFAAATVIDDKVYVVGGIDNLSGPALGELEVYDPATDEWTSKAPMPTPRSRFAAVSWRGKLYAIGGFYPTAEVYDPVTDTWSTAAPIPSAPWGTAAIALGDAIYVVGGGSGYDCAGNPHAYAFDPAADRWSPFPTPRVTRRYFALAETGGTLYIVGGTHGWMCGNAASIEALEIAPRLQFAWDLNHLVDADGDGNFTNDADATGATVEAMYGDDGEYVATLMVSDDAGNRATDSATVTILNTPPAVVSVETDLRSAGDLGLRVAGRKWNRATVTIEADGEPVGTSTAERAPGSPDDQIAWIPGPFDPARRLVAVVTYEPADTGDAAVGGNPVWLLAGGPDAFTVIGHHTFNVQQSERRGTLREIHVDPWIVEVTDALSASVAVIRVRAADNGSDDLTFAWGTGVWATYFNDGLGPDPRNSPAGVFPFSATDSAEIPYVPGLRVDLTIRDDDGGSVTISIAP